MGRIYLGDGIGSRVGRMEVLMSKDAAEVRVQGFESKVKEIFEERGEKRALAFTEIAVCPSIHCFI